MARPTNHREDNRPSEFEKKHLTVQRIIAFGGLIGVAVLIVQTCEMHRTTQANIEAANAAKIAGDAAKTAITEARKTTRLDQRAWVGVTSINCFKFEANKPYQVFVKFKNSGKTFAKFVKTALFLGVTPRSVPPDFERAFNRAPLGEPESTAVMAPNVEVDNYRWLGDGDDVPQELFDRVENGKFIIYVYGRVSYKDVFECEHWTNFCGKYLPERGAYLACNEFNDADKNDCP